MRESGRIRRYWDSSCFLCVVNEEPGFEVCQQILDAAVNAETVLCVSPMVYLEVVRPKGSPRVSDERFDRAIEWFESDHFHWRNIARSVARTARELCRLLNLHPRDAVHLACAVDLRCDLLETLDADLLRWDGRVPDSPIRIRRPTEGWQSDGTALQ